jgi:uncharacterized protein (TIGR02466 family)
MGSPPRKARARPENQRFISVSPRAGSLILFESWLKHEVPANRATGRSGDEDGSDERISVSFNYDWVR